MTTPARPLSPQAKTMRAILLGRYDNAVLDEMYANEQERYKYLTEEERLVIKALYALADEPRDERYPASPEYLERMKK